MRNLRPFAFMLSILVVCLLAAVFVVKCYWFRDQYVFVTVEESSINALAGWPLGLSELSEVFIDANQSTLVLSENKNLLGVCLGLYYSASSQGIEFNEQLVFSRTGKAVLDLPAPATLTAPNVHGELVELVNNQARVISGKLKVKKTVKDGTVYLEYGGKQLTLKPGEVWAELLVLDPDGPKAVSSNNWKEELQRCFENGYPATRLAIANRGLWPKSRVKVGFAHD